MSKNLESNPNKNGVGAFKKSDNPRGHNGI